MVKFLHLKKYKKLKVVTKLMRVLDCIRFVMDQSDEKVTYKKEDMPTCLLVMGMAGSGKTTFVQRLTAQMQLADPKRPPYVVNLDPAVAELQFPVQ